MSKESVSSPFSVSEEGSGRTGRDTGGQAENSNLCPLPVSLTKAFLETASNQIFFLPAGPESHDLLESERTETSVFDVVGSAGAEAAFSLGLLAELAVTADSMDEFNIESKAVRVCRSVTASYCLCWMSGGS